MKNIKKEKNSTFLQRVALTIGVATLFVAAPFIAGAQTADDLKAQIDELLKTITSLQEQLADLQQPDTTNPVSVSCGTFTRNLKMGSSGSEVLQLQQVLNRDASTQVAASGIGSAGNETEYFGSLTRQAVVRFQEHYASSILTPLGLTSGTGYVGASTREKLNGLACTDEAVDALPEGSDVADLAEVTELDTQGGDDLIVMFPSKYFAIPGTELRVHGNDFTAEGNTVHFGDEYEIADLSTDNSAALPFVVPDIPKGRYSLWVSNANGVSNKDSFFIVTGVDTPIPEITSLSPSTGPAGTVVTINGSAFTDTDNEIRNGYDILSGVASTDGETLTFTVEPPISGVPEGSEGTFDFWVYVVNNNGVTEKSIFTLTF